MLLVLVIILVLIWAAVISSIYSNFLVFYSNFSESENYHKAYYNSIAALERAELVTKQRAPWFIWSGWRILWESKWSYEWSDQIIDDNFSYLSDENIRNQTTIYRDINSRTTRIPSLWNWDVESMLAAWDSNNYNMMDYDNSQIFLLYYDKAQWNPYAKTSCTNWWSCYQSDPDNINGIIRLPWYMHTPWKFSDLDTQKELVSGWPWNDTIVDRQVRGKFLDSTFTIYSSQKVVWKQIIEGDNTFRESDINGWLNFKFWKSRDPTQKSSNSSPTIISQRESEIRYDSENSPTKFSRIFKSNYEQKQLRFSLLNLLKTNEWMIYPFLEYYVDFWWKDVSDKYFNIKAEWDFGDYKIRTIIWKPTIKESVLWSFTSIF